MSDKNEIVKAMMDVEIVPSFPKEELAKRGAIKVPLTELATGCAAFASLSSTFRTVTQTFEIPADGLYKFVSRGYGGGPTALKDGTGYISTVVHKGEGIIGQGAFVPVDGLEGTLTTTVPVDPMTLAIAVALAEVNQKLDAIKATQDEMFEYIKEDKRAEIRGDINTLSEVFNDFKLNSDNENWRRTRHQNVLDIKRQAEQHIEFYRAQIEKKAAEGGLLHGDREVAQKSTDLIDYLGQYQAALYMLGFSTFLDVVFSETFDADYLGKIAEKLERYGFDYLQLYTDAYNQLDEASSSSVEGVLIGGVATASSFLGKALSKVPILERGPVDVALQSAGESLKNLNENRQLKALEQVVTRRENSILPFARNVELIGRLYNDEVSYYLDGDVLYCDVDPDDDALPRC